MGLILTCPSCGLASNELRCPRCNALKIEGCTGACRACKSGSCKLPTDAPERRPSDEAREDEAHPGTPLER